MTQKTREETELELATQSVLADPRAREFLWWVLSQCGVYNAPHTVNGETGIHIGRRIIGVTIINQINATDPTAYAQMMIEAHNRADKREREENVRPVEE
ncbi:hypothetical protein [Pararhizobium qamdonense]|uniref:hypothetical protein n=1 Tax=Pararhizobium qamdonense TaxID=3031126 RepID=UPI0023E098EF|nr:hypothetical protein [Pararhizobium qamdonense]